MIWQLLANVYIDCIWLIMRIQFAMLVFDDPKKMIIQAPTLFDVDV